MERELVDPLQVVLPGEGNDDCHFFDCFCDIAGLSARASGGKRPLLKDPISPILIGRTQSQCDGIICPVDVASSGELRPCVDYATLISDASIKCRFFFCAGLNPQGASKLSDAARVNRCLEKFISRVVEIKDTLPIVAIGPIGFDYTPEGLLQAKQKKGGKKKKRRAYLRRHPHSTMSLIFRAGKRSGRQ